LPGHRDAALEAYFGEVPVAVNREWLRLGGEILDGIIRAGSVARFVCDLGAPADEQAHEFLTQVERAQSAMEAFYQVG